MEKKMAKKWMSICVSAALAVTLTGCAAADKVSEFFKTNIASTIAQLREISATEPPKAEATSAPEGKTAQVSNSLALGVTEIDTWNPIASQSELVREAMQFVYEPLFTLDAGQRAVAALAQDYAISPDGRTVEVNLKEGIYWHDGGRFDAYDVEYTVKKLKELNSAYSGNVADVAGCKAIGTNKVRFILTRSVPDFVSLLTFPIVRYQSAMDSGYTPVGTGPFQYYGKTGTDTYSFTANEGYRNGRPQIDKLDVCTIPDISKCYSMFEASEIDFITSRVVDIASEMPRGNIKTYDYVSNNMTYLGFNLQSEHLSGADTRIALSHLMNKEKLASIKLYSRVAATDLPFNPTSYVYYDVSPVLKDEPEKANEYLKKDGWEFDGEKYVRTVNGVKKTLNLRLLVNADSYRKMQTAQQIKDDFARHGIEVTIDALSYDSYAARAAAHNFDMFIGEANMGANQDLTHLTGGGNYFSYYNAELDTLIAQAGMTGDEEQKKQLYIQAGNTLMADMPFTPLYYAKESLLTGAKLKTALMPTAGAFYTGMDKWSVYAN